MPPRFLEKVEIFRFEKQYPQKYIAASLKENILATPKIWDCYATESLYRCITCQRYLRSTVTRGKAH